MSESQNFEESALTLLPPEDVNYDPAQFEDLCDGYLFGKYKNYRLKAKLGEGGMGQTWLAEELVENEVSQRVVLKILTQELRGNENALKEVRRVFDLTKNLNHSSICPLLGRYVDPNFGDFLVMKYANGGTLADWFNAQPGHENGLPLETLLPIFRPLAEALDLAHRNGILHRDVKPQNIMFMGKTPVLIDFGIAARMRVDENEKSRSTDSMIYSSSGSPYYRTPEQLQQAAQDHRTDQYSLALIFYEMFTGKRPFDSDPVRAAVEQVVFDPKKAEFPPHVNSAFAKALAYDMEGRFSTCAEFIDALTTPEPKPVQKPNVLLWCAVPFSLLLVLLIGIFIGKINDTANKTAAVAPEETAAPVSVAPEETATPEETPPAPPKPAVRKAGERMVKTVDGIEYAFCWCPPGSFLMGSPSSELARWGSETQHSVTLTRGFWMLETEVTQAMWQSVMGTSIRQQRDKSNQSSLYGEGSDYPMYYVSWEECRSFCEKLSEKLGLTVSLPTEAQWEYACRAGTTTAYSFGSSLNGQEANCDGNFPYGTSTNGPYLEKTVPVKSYAPNAWGLYDMHGNVWEWCQDWYDGDYYTESPTSDPTGPNSGSRRIYRGGGWCNDAKICRSAYRDGTAPGARNCHLGFRPVLASPAPGK